MATTLNPAPDDVGLGSPALGPWFYDSNFPANDVTLPVPDADLGVTLNITLGYQWLPPAQGVLSVHVATVPRPRPLEALRKPDGTPAFNDNKLIALFTLLPEVAARLHDLSRVIPSPDGKPSTAATRPRVRYIAMELPEFANQPASFNLFLGRFTSLANVPQPDWIETMGLALDAGGTTLLNTDVPMADLLRPGAIKFIGTPLSLLMFTNNEQVRLHAFDDQGWPIDPGAVAEWWRYLATTGYTNLWTPFDPPLNRTVGVAGCHTALLRNVHGGQLDGPLAARLQTANAAVNGPLHTRNGGSNGIAYTFSAPAAIDDAPLPRAAVLPHGSFDTTLTLWQGTPALTRDYCRITAVDIEHHLLGQSRLADAAATDSAKRRAADQNDPLRRARVERCAGAAGVLHATTGDGLNALFNGPLAASPAAGAQGRLVAPVLDSDWGPHSAVTCMLPPPSTLPAIQVDALVGGDSTPTRGQQVLVRLTLSQPQVLAGAWVRAWPLGFDIEMGVHRPLDGGAGRSDINGKAALVVTLPKGQGTGQLGMLLMITTATGSRSYTEHRFTRPAEKGGTPSVGAPAGANVLLCEQGLSTGGGSLAGLVQAGTTLVIDTGSGFRLIDRNTLTVGDFAPATLVSRANNRLIAELTQPAYKKQPSGDTTALSNAGAAVLNTQRSGFNGMLTPGQPLPGQERLEVAYSLAANGSAQAYVGSAPALSRCGELLPHQSGHPGVPAGVEVHGTAALLDALAASSVEELTRDRIDKWCDDLVNAAVAAPTPPAAATGPSRWAATLKTVGAGIEGEFGMLLGPINYASYPFAGTYANVQAWYNSQAPIDPSIVMDFLPDVTAGSPGEKLALRAMHRRVRAAGWGMQEAAVSLQAAFARAEQLVYIETPFMDTLDIGKPDAPGGTFDILNPIQALIARAQAAPRLRVILCLPVRPLPGYPKGYDKVRLSEIAKAVDALRAALGDARLVVFTPSAGAGQRSVRLASTSVVIDDAYALTGSSHLSRRGLSYDGSLAVTVFDDVLEHGAPREVRNFRRALIAGRLGVAPGNLPDDPRSLVELVQALNQNGSARVDGDGLPPLPATPPTTTEVDGWNPEGSSFAQNINIMQWLQGLVQANSEDVGDEVV